MATGIRIRTAGSEWWAVTGRPTETTVMVTRAKVDGEPREDTQRYDACAICFAGDPEYRGPMEDVHNRHRISGFCAPAVVMGRCSWCGFVHDEKQALRMDEVTTDNKAKKAEAEE